jgi:hypothetical protein
MRHNGNEAAHYAVFCRQCPVTAFLVRPIFCSENLKAYKNKAQIEINTEAEINQY